MARRSRPEVLRMRPGPRWRSLSGDVQKIGLDDVAPGKKNVQGCEKDLAETVRKHQPIEPPEQPRHEALMEGRRRGAHVVLSIEDLVPVPVVRDEDVIVVAQLANAILEGHGSFMVPLAENWRTSAFRELARACNVIPERTTSRIGRKTRQILLQPSRRACRNPRGRDHPPRGLQQISGDLRQISRALRSSRPRRTASGQAHLERRRGGRRQRGGEGRGRRGSSRRRIRPGQDRA